MKLLDKCRNFTEATIARQQGWYPYFKVVESEQGAEVIVEGRRMIMIGSNNYLGLTSHPKVKEAAINAIKKYGTGCTGSRYLNGTLALHEEAEARLAKFMQREAALLFSTGYQTNLGTISALVGKGDFVITDRQDHASIIDGCRLSFGKMLKFRHNDVEDLERILRHLGPEAGKMVVVDGVFSMEGSIANLPAIAALCQEYRAVLVVDDAHAIGVLGQHGRGTGEHFGLEHAVDIAMGTFSKSFASMGGFIATDFEIIDYIKHHSRPLIFSASMAPANVAAVIAALDIIEQEPERREWLWRNANHLRNGLKALGFNTGNSATPIIPVILGDDMLTFRFWRELFERGVFTNPAVRQAVAPGCALLRTSVIATHTPAHIDRVLEVFAEVGRKLGVIP
ncbi:MAG: 2-amino-3-ketobutyrate CoA ligase [Candidatus Tectimicrobiota bacterium]|nr:MAG: 2-amino-3-ketobutyrate CoA ligase [Candidatus Tectomicrobia bacterium]